MMSRVGVYISVIIVFCHSIRLVPNTWELIQRKTVNEEVTKGKVIFKTVWLIGSSLFLGLYMASLGGYHHNDI